MQAPVQEPPDGSRKDPMLLNEHPCRQRILAEPTRLIGRA